MNEMRKYCVLRSCGYPDQGKWIVEDASDVDAVRARLDKLKLQYYVTKNNDSWPKICNAMAIEYNQRKLYYQWLSEQHGYGLVSPKQSDSFKDPKLVPYSTNALQSWASICTECRVPSDQHREYLLWIRDNHKLGNREEFKADDAATFFPSPLKTNKRRVNQMAFTNFVKAGTRFPRVDGEEHSQSWLRHIRLREVPEREFFG